MKTFRAIKIITTIAALGTAIALVDGYDITYKDAWIAFLFVALIIIHLVDNSKKEIVQ